MAAIFISTILYLSFLIKYIIILINFNFLFGITTTGGFRQGTFVLHRNISMFAGKHLG